MKLLVLSETEHGREWPWHLLHPSWGEDASCNYLAFELCFVFWFKLSLHGNRLVARKIVAVGHGGVNFLLNAGFRKKKYDYKLKAWSLFLHYCCMLIFPVNPVFTFCNQALFETPSNFHRTFSDFSRPRCCSMENSSSLKNWTQMFGLAFLCSTSGSRGRGLRNILVNILEYIESVLQMRFSYKRLKKIYSFSQQPFQQLV